MNDFSITESVAYAGFWTRAVAAAIDAVLIGFLQGALFFTVLDGGLFDPGAESLRPFYVLATQVVPATLAIAFWVKWSATPGKMILGLRIVDASTGGRPSLRQYLERYFAYYLSSLPFGLGFLWVAWDRRKQGWHDKLAGTVVVRRAPKGAEVARFEAA